MARIVRDSGGRKRIQFNLEGKRKTIRIGKATMKNAEVVKTKVEALLDAG